MKPILELKNISFFYPESNNGVKDVSLSISEDEILGLIGANGSGKTTLAKIILGLLKPKKGKIEFGRKEITKLDVFKRARRIGYVTQDPIEMFFENSVFEEVRAGPKFLSLFNPEKKAEKALKLLNLWHYKDKHPDSLSGGEKRLLSIADILVNDPEILILDEPEFGLDPKTWRMIAQETKELKLQGKTIVVITQDLKLATFLCDRIALMKEGKILKVGSPKEIFSDTELLQEAGLTPLPFFAFLDKIEDGALESEEKFIEALAKKINQNKKLKNERSLDNYKIDSHWSDSCY